MRRPLDLLVSVKTCLRWVGLETKQNVFKRLQRGNAGHGPAVFLRDEESERADNESPEKLLPRQRSQDLSSMISIEYLRQTHSHLEICSMLDTFYQDSDIV
jgi:hypothetical protein